MAKKFEIDVVKAVTNGVVNAFKLREENQYLIAICYNGGSYILPLIDKAIYVNISDPDSEAIVEAIVETIINKKTFPELNGTKIKYKTAPEHSMIIKAPLVTKGARHYEGINKILQDAGYIVNDGVKAKAVVRDSSELIKNDPLARAIIEENAEELKKVGANLEKLSTDIITAFEVINYTDCFTIIFSGPTGTGKSWACRIIAHKMQMPYLTLQIDRGTSVETLVGMFVPKSGESVDPGLALKIIDIIRDTKLTVSESLEKAKALIKAAGETGKWEFIPGPLLKAFNEGWIIVIEEANFGDPGVLAKLNEFTDGTLRVTINGIPYKKHPNFIVMMTMNPGYNGTEVLNKALKGRFIVINVPKLTKEQFSERMIGYSKGYGFALSKAFYEKLYDFGEKIEKIAQSSSFHEDLTFSVRNAQALTKAILIKPVTFEKFKSAINISYLNCLNLDNDNSEKVENLKLESEINNDILSLYDSYDFAEIPTAEKLLDLSDFITDAGDSGDDDDSLIDDITDLSEGI